MTVSTAPSNTHRINGLQGQDEGNSRPCETHKSFPVGINKVVGSDAGGTPSSHHFSKTCAHPSSRTSYAAPENRRLPMQDCYFYLEYRTASLHTGAPQGCNPTILSFMTRPLGQVYTASICRQPTSHQKLGPRFWHLTGSYRLSPVALGYTISWATCCNFLLICY